MISAFGVLATILAGLGLFLTYQNTQKEQQLTSERLVTDRFAKAIEQLGSKEINVRIGAIYSLERIAKDSPKDHGTIMEVLMAFARNKSPLPKDWKHDSEQKLPRVTADVQSALTVIRRREVMKDPKAEFLDLSSTNLSHANLYAANLKGANLSGANLYRADFYGVRFNDANLYRAKLFAVNLSLTNFDNANIGGAELGGAHGMTTEQIKRAENWQKAKYDSEFHKELELPVFER